MKTFLFTLIFAAAGLVATADEVMKKDGDTYIVNTTTLSNTRGFKSTTPLLVYINAGKVIRIESLPNEESKGYYRKVELAAFPKYNALKVSKAKKLSKRPQIDGFTGATFSTKAVQENIHRALLYYEKHK